MPNVTIDTEALAAALAGLLEQFAVDQSSNNDSTVGNIIITGPADPVISDGLFDSTISQKLMRFREQYRELFPAEYPGGSSRRKIDTLALHCSATRDTWLADQDVLEKREEIDRWHRGRGWRGFGYHGLLDRDGTAATGRALSETGAHIKGHNETSVGFCIVGGHGSATTDAFEDNFTNDQYWSLFALIERMVAVLPDLKYIVGHNQFANKACPGFDVTELLHSDPTFNAYRDYAL